MKFSIKFLTILIVVIILISSIYVLFSLDEGEDNEKSDTIPPTIGPITGDTTGTIGKITTITVTFFDNINVTTATIYYKPANSEEWINASILSGSYDIEIPSDSDDEWHYYITINDAAGNGPVGNPSNDGSIYYTITIRENIEDLVHTVFIEEASGEHCDYCPGVSEVIHDLFESRQYNFYYVSMVEDYDKASDRLYSDYNLYGLPTVYIDGGFKVLVGGGETKDKVNESKYIEAITTAEKRNVPKIKVNVTVDYTNNSDNFITNVVVKNFEEDTYTGILKVYLAEIISDWKYKVGVGGNIRNAFLDYIINEEISVEAGEKYSISEDWDLSNLYPANLNVIAVVFNSESEKSYSDPSGATTDKHPFDAYFADATDGTYVIAGGDLPPEVWIANPVSGKQHFFGIPLFDTILRVTRLIGRTWIQVSASDDSKVEKIEFYIDGDLVFTDTEAPYEYTLHRIGLFKSIFFRKHTIKVIAYDDTGKTSTDELEIRARL